MNISVSTKFFGPVSLAYCLEKISRYANIVEIGRYHVDEFMSSKLAPNTKIYSVHAREISPKDDADFTQRYRNYYGPIFEKMQKQGIFYYVDHLGFKNEKGNNLKAIYDNVASLNDFARKSGVYFSIENGSHLEVMNQPGEIASLFKYVGEGLTFTLDFIHAKCAGADLKDFIELLGEKMVNVHIADIDFSRFRFPEQVMLGDWLIPGMTDSLRKPIMYLKEKGYQGPLTLEVEEYYFCRTAVSALNVLKSISSELEIPDNFSSEEKLEEFILQFSINYLKQLVDNDVAGAAQP